MRVLEGNAMFETDSFLSHEQFDDDITHEVTGEPQIRWLSK